jgi:hypothetical protein
MAAVESKKSAALSAAVVIGLALLGWSFSLGARLSAVESKAEQAGGRIERVEREAEGRAATLQSIDQRLARIEGKLDRR